MSTNLLLLSFIIFLANTIECIIGFGGTLIALSVGSLFYPLDELIAILLPLNVIMSFHIFYFNRKQVDYHVLTKKILPFMLFGLLLGIMGSQYISGASLKRLLVLVVMFSAIKELKQLISKKETRNSLLPAGIWIWVGGIVHGIYTTGGPFLVTAINQLIKEPLTIRNTLATLWLMLNIIMCLTQIYLGKLKLAEFKMSLLLVPTVFVSVFLGNRLLKKMPVLAFRYLTVCLLIACSLLIIIN